MYLCSLIVLRMSRQLFSDPFNPLLPYRSSFDLINDCKKLPKEFSPWLPPLCTSFVFLCLFLSAVNKKNVDPTEKLFKKLF